MGADTRPGMKRLARLYAMVERVRSLQVVAAAGAVMEVEHAARHLEAIRCSESLAGREALARGSRVEQCAVERTKETHQGTRIVLAKLAAQRREAHASAAHEHSVSRMELRQLEGVVERARQAAGLEQDRRAQAVSDDWFLSRKAWLEAREADWQGQV